MPDSAATDYDDFAARLAAQACAKTCPSVWERVAAFATEHPDEGRPRLRRRVAARAGVKPSTLVRFAKALNYDGFSELQQIFRSRLKERAFPTIASAWPCCAAPAAPARSRHRCWEAPPRLRPCRLDQHARLADPP